MLLGVWQSISDLGTLFPWCLFYRWYAISYIIALPYLLERNAHDRLFKLFFELLYWGRKIYLLLGHPEGSGNVLLRI